MAELIALSAKTLLSPAILFFLLGFLAALARSDLSIPETLAKGLAIYLMVAIGFKGGVEVAAVGLIPEMLWAAGLGMVLSFLFPYLAFAVLRSLGGLDRLNAGAIAAHYGSISVVTFATAIEVFKLGGVQVPGYMVAVMALMETPAIISGLMLARSSAAARKAASLDDDANERKDLWHEVLLNGSVVLLIGAFVIGALTGAEGKAVMAPLIDKPFKAVLCFFLLDMGLVAARQLMGARLMSPRIALCGLVLPPIGGALGGLMAWSAGLPVGAIAAMAALGASASYIAVPAAIRLTLPQANPGLYLTLSLAVTFPFNVTLGLPLYLYGAKLLSGSG